MKIPLPPSVHRNFKLLVLWGAIAAIGWLAQLPKLSRAESALLANRFRFDRAAFPRPAGMIRSHREVNPKLQSIVSWASAVGSGIALGDLDGDGLPNDACLVEPRTDEVIVTPAPGTGDRYTSFVLLPPPSVYSPSSTAPMGCILTDLNEDGLLDAVVYYWGRTPVAFLRQPTKARARISAAAFVPQELLAGAERWYTNAGLIADIDGDGHADLVFGNYFADGSAVLGEGPAEMHASLSRAVNGGSKQIMLWKSAKAGERPGVEFIRVPNLGAVLGTGWTLGMGACDLDGDLLPDLYIANDFGPDKLLHNISTPGHVAFQTLAGHRGWTTPKSKVIGQDSFKGMGVDCSDLNGDGLPDLMIGNITDPYALEESNLVYVSTGDFKALQAGVAPYREQSESLGLARGGWSWDVRFGDFDNDSVDEIVQATGFMKGATNRWPELQELAMGNDLMLRSPKHWPRFVSGDDLSGGNHDQFYVRSSSGRYFDLGATIGLGEPFLTRGVAVADIDGDGRLDFVLSNQWEDSYVFHNVSKSSGAFLGLHLLLPVAPAPGSIYDGHPSGGVRAYSAMTARVTVYLPDGRRLVKQVDGGNGHSGKSSPDLHFGLGGGLGGGLGAELGGTDRAHLLCRLDWRDQQGVIQHLETHLTPGWHTVLLGRK